MCFLESKGMCFFVRFDDLIICFFYFFLLNVSDLGVVNEIFVWCWGEYISFFLKLLLYCFEFDFII